MWWKSCRNKPLKVKGSGGKHMIKYEDVRNEVLKKNRRNSFVPCTLEDGRFIEIK